MQVPYSFFHQQVQAGNSTQIAATDNAVQGTFRTPVSASQANGDFRGPSHHEGTY